MNWSSLVVPALVTGVFVFLVRFLRTLYASGELRGEELGIVRSAQLMPLGILILLLVAEVLLIGQARPLIPWMPHILGLTVAIAAVWALERSRQAVLRHRHAEEET